MGLMLERIEDEDDEIVANDQDVERLVIVTQVWLYDHSLLTDLLFSLVLTLCYNCSHES